MDGSVLMERVSLLPGQHGQQEEPPVLHHLCLWQMRAEGAALGEAGPGQGQGEASSLQEAH